MNTAHVYHKLDNGKTVHWNAITLAEVHTQNLRSFKSAEEFWMYATGANIVDFISVEPTQTTVPTPSNPLDVQVGGSHYKHFKIQPVEYTRANRFGDIEAAIIWYISRWQVKGGFQDLEKIKHFCDLLMEMEVKYHDGDPTKKQSTPQF